MRPGEKFETECYNFLKKVYKTANTDFYHEGGMDSTKSDIEVIKNGKKDFFIEAKDALAQSGQFVLLPNKNTETFIFSPRNKSLPNEMTNMIIDYMNNDFHRFNNAGTAGQSIDIDKKIFAKWIIKHYEEKNVKYVISKGNDYVIFPIRKFPEYFDIVANFRVKKSGSGYVAKKDIDLVKQNILAIYPTAKFIQSGKKLYVEINEPFKKDKLIIKNYTYQLSKQSSNYFEVRRLSNTYNMNVIFAIKLIKAQDENDLIEFKSEI
ncbi:MAG: hypothetical protein E7565_08450 [Ruminococcaceae bacterium]|nr:hypothetical protein [Oscillospiraceae bacterium]